MAACSKYILERQNAVKEAQEKIILEAMTPFYERRWWFKLVEVRRTRDEAIESLKQSDTFMYSPWTLAAIHNQGHMSEMRSVLSLAKNSMGQTMQLTEWTASVLKDYF